MKLDYRHIVLGAGAIGAATAYRLGVKSGGDVLVLEQFELGHSLGASEDHSRIIRHAYNSPSYTALTRQAYAAWEEIEAATGVPLLLRTGGLNICAGSSGAVNAGKYATAMDEAGHDYEVLDSVETMRRWPQWQLTPDAVSLFQKDSGILDIRKANAAHIALARETGVTFLAETPVERVVSHPDHVEVHTAQGVFTAATLSICAGSWTTQLTDGLGVHVPVTLTAEQVTYWSTVRLRDFSPANFGIWVYIDDSYTFYGFPVYGEAAVKAGRDEPGKVVTQETRSWAPDPVNRGELEAFMAAHLPTALGPELMTKTCVYDLTPDRDFLLDVLPGHPRISVFVGGGHAGKFAALMGCALADLASEGGTDLPIKPFRFDRPAITDPSFVPTIRLIDPPAMPTPLTESLH